LSDLASREAKERGELAQLAASLPASGETIVAVSLGADGLLVACEGEVFTVRPPRLDVKSAVGSGDCLLAGMVYGLTHDLSLREAARYGVAAGTANALTVGAGSFSSDDFRRILAEVEVEVVG
jgi:fructose-1-phosphate kinase PfkB-like protein